MYQTRCEGQLSSKQNLNRNLFQTNSKRNLYQRIFFIWKNMPTQKSLKRNLYEKKIWREISPQKKCSNNLSSKNSTKLWGDILCQKKMKTNLYQTIVQAAFPCKIMKKISTKKSEKQSQPKINGGPHGIGLDPRCGCGGPVRVPCPDPIGGGTCCSGFPIGKICAVDPICCRVVPDDPGLGKLVGR